MQLSKYLNPKNYARSAVAFGNKKILGQVETWFAPAANLPLRHPPIFVVGAPRSGSTLMIQVITDALDLGYISNRHCQWFGAPALAERLFQPTAHKPVSDYQSAHGTTTGPHAPAECGQWWYRFFRHHPPYVTLQDVDPIKMQRFRQSIATLTNAFDKPLLFKNLYASLRIQAIAHYLPESLFIVTHRDEITNGHSLLEGRFKVYKDYSHWWSSEPPAIEALKKLPAHEQVIEQIRHIHTAIDNDLKIAGVSASRRFDISYEKFCASPHETIKDLRLFLKSNQSLVNQTGVVPARFDIRDKVRIDNGLYESMVKYAKNKGPVL